MQFFDANPSKHANQITFLFPFLKAKIFVRFLSNKAGYFLILINLFIAVVKESHSTPKS